jgi:STE24 endopeptidase
VSPRRPRSGEDVPAAERVWPWAVAAVALAAVGVAGTVWRPVAPDVGAVATDVDRFGPAVLEAVRAYRAPRYVVSVLATVLAVAVPVLLVVTARGRRVLARLAGPAASWWRVLGVAVAVAVLTSLATLPLGVWSRIVHDGRWGFRTASAGRWAADWAIVVGGRAVLTGLLVTLLLAAAVRWPRSWPYRVTVAGTAVVAVFVLLHPVVVQPLLLPTVPLPDGEVRDVIEEVMARADDVDAPIVLGQASLRTTRVNAAVVGLGPTERVVVHDTLLELPSEQVAAVVAHELAHREHADLVRGVLLGAVALLAGALVLRAVLQRPWVRRELGSRGPADPRLAAVVLAVVAVIELVGAPVGNAVSRRVELAADARALELTGEPASLVRTTRAFAVRDLSAPEPPVLLHRYFGTHPSVGQRLRYAAAWADANGLALPTSQELAAEERDLAHPAVGEGPP